MDKIRVISLPSTFFWETTLLCSMVITLLIPSQLNSVIVWSDLPFLSFLRALVWLSGLSILPGLFVLRLTRVANHLSRIGKIAIGINLSFIIVGIATLILYFGQVSLTTLPWLFLGFMLLCSLVYWRRHRDEIDVLRMSMTKWHMLLLITVLATVFLAFLVQLNNRYLVPGDNWVSLKPAVSIASGENVYESFATAEYPIMFGFVLAGLAVCSGFPVVNTYVLLFPLTALNVVCFFELVKTVFDRNNKIAALSAIIYGLGGGLGWLIQMAVINGPKDFWTVSLLSQDMYFFSFFWNAIEFSFKSLAITLIYMSIAAFVISARIEKQKTKIASLVLSSLLMLFSFFIHMIDVMLLAPVILAIVYFYLKGHDRYLQAGVFLAITAVIAGVTDLLTHGFYSSLLLAKAPLFLSAINIGEFWIILFAVLGTAPIVVILTKLFFSNRSDEAYSFKKYPKIAKSLFVLSLFALYLAGLLVQASLPSVAQLYAGFPWYRYVTRYGFVGGLALVGLAVTPWKEKWFRILLFWSFFSICLGSMWWGERTNGYLFPMLSVMAAVAIEWVWEKASGITLHFSSVSDVNMIHHFKTRLEPIAATLIVVMLVLSFTSVMYGASYYAFVESPVDDDTARVLSWVSQNISSNSTVIVPKTYAINKGIYTISNREVYENSKLPQLLDAQSFINLTQTLCAKNIRYTVTTDTEPEQSVMLRYLNSYSNLMFQSGTIKVFQIPNMHPPFSGHTVATINREPLGLLSGSEAFGWFDDSFLTNWTYTYANASSNGELLTFTWQFKTGTVGLFEPVMKNVIQPLDTNKYPYLVVKYRNTAQTSDTAENNISQIISLFNQTGSSRGFLENVYLPVVKSDSFSLVSYKLPRDQNITSINIWMRNSRNLNGTIQMQIDYLGFSSHDSLISPEGQMSFLSMALPSIWPTNYTIVSDFNETGNASIIVTLYDNTVENYVENSTSVNAFVFLSPSANTPLWGTEWREIKPGLISGFLQGRKVIILGVNSLQGDLTTIAETIYEEIST